MRKVYRDKCLPPETRKISNNLTLYHKQPRERTKPKVGRRKETTKITVEIKMKDTEKINETKKCFFEGMIKMDKALARIPKEKRTEQKSKRCSSRHHRTTKNHNKLPGTVMCQQIGQPTRNG